MLWQPRVTKEKPTLPSITSGFIHHFSTVCMTACLWIAICIFSLVYSVLWIRCAIFLSLEIFPPISKGWGSACFQFLLCRGRLLITSTRAWKNGAWGRGWVIFSKEILKALFILCKCFSSRTTIGRKSFKTFTGTF